MTVRLIDRATGAIVGILALFVIAVLTGVVSAGPLDPSSGPGSTPGVRLPGTPISTLPVTINTSGHYYLTNDVIGPADSAGITVAANDVTLDLGGFTMTGDDGSLDGIFVNAPFQNVVVRNGSIVDWDAAGIEVSNAREAVIEDIHVSNSGGSGIVTANGARISRCTSAQNGNHGIDAGDANVITDCTALDNNDFGIFAGAHSVLSRVVASSNGSGISAGPGAHVSMCAANGNNSGGIRVLDRSTVDGCTASDTVLQAGILGLGESIVIRNSTASNNGFHGIDITGAGGLVENSTASSNTTVGIRLQLSGIVRGSTARNNDAHGIYVVSNALVEGNVAQGNGVLFVAAGIFAEANGNHIERNLSISNDKGIDAAGVSNTVIGNTARSNGAAGITDEFVLSATTVAGPILDGDTVDTATNPYANFSQ